MKNLLITSIFSLFSIGLFAQSKYLKDVSETQELSIKVVDLFYKNKILETFEELKPYWPLPQNELDVVVQQTIKYKNVIEERYGKSIGILKVKNEKIAEIALRETYFIRYEKNAIRLIFTYYKNEEGWIVNAFKWDDSFAEEFE